MSVQQKPRPTRKQYRVVVALFPEEWYQLRQWAELRDITGGELIGSVLSHWLVVNKPPAEIVPPDEPPEDA